MKMYIGIDISKYDFVSAAETEDSSLSERHPKINNNQKGFRELHRWIKGLMRTCEVESVHIGIESTGGYERSLVEWFYRHTDFLVTVLNPIRVKRYGQSQLIRTKTDEVDVWLIVRYMRTHSPEPTQELSEEMKKLKSLTRHLEHLKQKRADEKTYLSAVRDNTVKTMVRQTIKNYDKQIEKVEKKINDHFDDYPDLKSKRKLLKSIVGFGDTTASVLLSEMIDSLDPKKQVAHAGLAPRERQSGLLRGKPQICKTGNKRLRAALYLPTLSAIKSNPVISKQYKRLVDSGKPKQVAVCACMRKLIHIAMGVLKNQTPFDPNYGMN